MNKYERLDSYIAKYIDVPFQTGVNDCALFAASWVKELIGIDLAERFRGKYKTDFASARLIKKLGYEGIEHLVYSEFDRIGTRLEYPLLAARGDIAWVDNAGGKLCGIVGASGIYILSNVGVVITPISEIIAAWSIRECN